VRLGGYVNPCDAVVADHTDRLRTAVEPYVTPAGLELRDLAAHLTPEEMWGVDDALATVLDLR